jgi:hypothetical protein
MGEEDLVTVHIVGDVAAGEMLTELLRAEGIAAQLSSVSSALLGAAPHLFQTKVLVPAADAARAAEILRELETTAGEAGALQAPAGEIAPDALASSPADSPAVSVSEADDGRAAGPTPRRPRVAAAFAFLFPGGGHLYAGATVTAIVVEVAMGACVFLLLRGRARMFQQYAAFATVVALAVTDSWGAVRLVRAHLEGRWSPPLARAIARGLLLVVLAAAAGSAVAALASIPRWNREQRLAPFSVHCGQDFVVIHNGAAGPRSVTISRVQVLEVQPDERRWYDVSVVRGDMQLLPAGGDGSATLGVLPELAARCASWERKETGPNGCAMRFRVRFEEPETSPRPAPVYGVGVCDPPWGQPAERRAGRLWPERED